jgi:hypothetical protein
LHRLEKARVWRMPYWSRRPQACSHAPTMPCKERSRKHRNDC